MDDHPDGEAVSFFKLAERYEMARSRKRGWRDRHRRSDDWPARRHRRRRRIPRRERRPSRDYFPMEVDSRSASRGIQTRLLGAIGSALLTVICLMSIFLATEITLGSTFPLAVGLGSLGLSIALTMSARREEIVHQVAGELNQDLDGPTALLDGVDSDLPRLEDGHLEEQRMMESLSVLESEVPAGDSG